MLQEGRFNNTIRRCELEKIQARVMFEMLPVWKNCLVTVVTVYTVIDADMRLSVTNRRYVIFFHVLCLIKNLE